MLSTKQLKEIRKVSMARIICDNSASINSIQPQVFRGEGTNANNRKVSCKDFKRIPTLDIRAFSEGL